MFLSIHGPIGIIIGQSIASPFLAFLIGFISHYIVDMIPHGDTNAPKKYKNPIHIGFAAIIDFIILVLVLVFINFRVDILKINILLAVFGALLPDFMQAIYFFSNKRIFKNWQKAHDRIHDFFIKKFEWKFSTGIILQTILLIILILIIIV